MLLKLVRSTLADDPDYKELVCEFVSNVPSRVRSIRRSIADNDLKQLCSLIHQLKGACGSYGFHDITPLATTIEHQIGLGSDVSKCVPSLEVLLESCLRMTSESPVND